MNKAVLGEFLSDDNISLHHSYMKDKYLKYSILKKGREELNGVKLEEVHYLRIPRNEREMAHSLLSEVESHKCYFDSFEICGRRCENIRKCFGSEDAMLYEVLETAKHAEQDFVYIYSDGGRVKIMSANPSTAFLRCRPILALDLCEHAYFIDYAFDKERYLRAALAHLNLEKLDKSMSGT